MPLKESYDNTETDLNSIPDEYVTRLDLLKVIQPNHSIDAEYQIQSNEWMINLNRVILPTEIHYRVNVKFQDRTIATILVNGHDMNLYTDQSIKLIGSLKLNSLTILSSNSLSAELLLKANNININSLSFTMSGNSELICQNKISITCRENCQIKGTLQAKATKISVGNALST